MGLDSYLEGRKFLWQDYEHPERDPMEDGFRITERILSLGYWRKHPNLHGYIVQEFADGEDKCQDIELSADDLRKIIKAIKDSKLPHTEGFFFGQSDDGPKQRKHDMAIFEAALKWVENQPAQLKTKKRVLGGGMVAIEIEKQEAPKESRYVVYRASW